MKIKDMIEKARKTAEQKYPFALKKESGEVISANLIWNGNDFIQPTEDDIGNSVSEYLYVIRFESDENTGHRIAEALRNYKHASKHIFAAVQMSEFLKKLGYDNIYKAYKEMCK